MKTAATFEAKESSRLDQQLPARLANRSRESVKLISSAVGLDRLKLVVSEILRRKLGLDVLRIKLFNDAEQWASFAPGQMVTGISIYGQYGDMIGFIFIRKPDSGFGEKQRLLLKSIVPHIGIAFERAIAH